MPTHGSTLSPRSRFREGSSRMSGNVGDREDLFWAWNSRNSLHPRCLRCTATEVESEAGFLKVEDKTFASFEWEEPPVTLPLIVFFHPIIVLLLVHVTLTFHDVREKLPLVPLRYACGSLFNPIRLGSSRSHASVRYS